MRDYEEFLVQRSRQRCWPAATAVARLLRQARFPDLKTRAVGLGCAAGRRAAAASQLASEYIERAEDVVIAGPIGTGKTHLAIARRRGRPPPPPRRVRAPADLVRELLEARDELTLSRLHQRYLRVALLIVDARRPLGVTV